MATSCQDLHAKREPMLVADDYMSTSEHTLSASALAMHVLSEVSGDNTRMFKDRTASHQLM